MRSHRMVKWAARPGEGTRMWTDADGERHRSGGHLSRGSLLGSRLHFAQSQLPVLLFNRNFNHNRPGRPNGSSLGDSEWRALDARNSSAMNGPSLASGAAAPAASAGVCGAMRLPAIAVVTGGRPRVAWALLLGAQGRLPIARFNPKFGPSSVGLGSPCHRLYP